MTKRRASGVVVHAFNLRRLSLLFKAALKSDSSDNPLNTAESALVEVYCDGGIWQGVMTDAVTAYASDYVGRTAVVIPDLNYGVVECFHDSLVLANGHEDVFHAEVTAVKHADDACRRKELREGFVIYSDNGGAVRESNLSYVQLIPEGKFHFADEYLTKMRSRAGYVRRSTGNVSFRHPTSPINEEIKRLMTAERIEFQLSDSPLFQKFKSEAKG